MSRGSNIEDPVQIFVALLAYFGLVLCCFGMGYFFAWITGIGFLLWFLFIVLFIPSTVMFWAACFPEWVGEWLETRRVKAAERLGIDPEEVKRRR